MEAQPEADVYPLPGAPPGGRAGGVRGAARRVVRPLRRHQDPRGRVQQRRGPPGVHVPRGEGATHLVRLPPGLGGAA